MDFVFILKQLLIAYDTIGLSYLNDIILVVNIVLSWGTLDIPTRDKIPISV